MEHAVAAFRRGELVVVTDDRDRENEGDLFIPAAAVDTAAMAFLMRHTSGIVCVSMPGERLDRLGLRPMVPKEANAEAMRTAFTVSVDARDGVTTGVSAADRVATTKVLADPASEPGDLVRPGHLFPLRAHPDGVLGRRGHTEAAHDLAVLAGIPPVVVLSELMHPDGTMMRAPAIAEFCERHGLVRLSVDDLVRYRSLRPGVVERGAATVPRADGAVRVLAFESPGTGVEHAAVVVGELGDMPPLVRVHSECFTGDLLGSDRCDCGEQLRESLRLMREEGSGVLIYLRGHEGRGIGLGAKLRAYRLQDGGLDTVDANAALGLPVDARRYEDAAEILHALGASSVRLLTNNPDKVRQLRENGIKVTESVSLPATVTPHNKRYLAAKHDRLGHRPDALAAALEAGDG
ncbi:MAG TPA: 3,4-dihydroxy-2-butanone-4-phosphate synthase [Amycolatopsis sp.]|nr:3,4-dihydroxy-2-butanone-4-phosphate synthase [Amycolatopsis sp.]